MTISSQDLRSAADPQSVMTAQQPAAPAGETAGTVLAAQAVAVIQARTALAVARPRDLDVVRQKLLKECRRPGFAKVAIYRKPIGNGVEGLSIRFVEAAIRCMGNVACEVQTIFDDEGKRIVRVTVTDLESNVPYFKEITIAKQIERRRYQEGDVVLRKRLNSEGKTVFILKADDEQILDKENALVSKAIRTEGLRLVPGDIQDECEALCYRIRADEAAKDPDGERRNIIDGFGGLGVPVDELKKYLGHDGSTITPKELANLRSLYVALREEETTWREIMENRGADDKKPAPKQPDPTPKPVDPPVTRVEKAVAPQAAATAAKEPEKPAAQAKVLDDEFAISNTQPPAKAAEAYDPAEQPEGGDGRPTFDEIIKAIANASDARYIQESIIPMIGEIPNPNHRASLEKSAKNKMKSLAGPTNIE